jgi:hypothetical protein
MLDPVELYVRISETGFFYVIQCIGGVGVAFVLSWDGSNPSPPPCTSLWKQFQVPKWCACQTDLSPEVPKWCACQTDSFPDVPKWCAYQTDSSPDVPKWCACQTDSFPDIQLNRLTNILCNYAACCWVFKH